MGDHHSEMMHRNGKIGCISFLVGLFLQFLCEGVANNVSLFLKEDQGTRINEINHLLTPTLCFSVLFVTSFLVSKKCFFEQTHEFVWRSCFLGIALAFGIRLSLSEDGYFSFGWYTSIMSLFHFSEFVITSIIRPKNLSPESFLLNHSKAYAIAALTSWVEYLIEWWIFPGWKSITWISGIGLFLCLGGEILRKTAMLTAFHNFDHLIRTRREEHHQLVTTGIYSLCRHPSYVGWFYWSIGTQLILCNPLCAIAYTITSWKFFHERVFEEEMTLLHFFGNDYVAYQAKVPTGLPLISGYSINS